VACRVHFERCFAGFSRGASPIREGAWEEEPEGAGVAPSDQALALGFALRVALALGAFLGREDDLAATAHRALLGGTLRLLGMWRSLVARLSGGQEVAGSSPAIPTLFDDTRLTLRGSREGSAGRFVVTGAIDRDP
jgi:hypothetical protein